jgi:hypothetical protein
MKKIIVILAAILAFGELRAQYFEATITNSGNSLIFSVRPKPGGGNITLAAGTELTNVEFYVRYPSASAGVFTFGTPVAGPEFPGLVMALKGTDPFGAYPGKTTAWFQWLSGGSNFVPSSGLPRTYVAGTVYEMFRIPILGTPPATVDFELVHNTSFVPSYIAITDRNNNSLCAVNNAGTTIGDAFFGLGFTIAGSDHILLLGLVPVPVKFNNFSAVRKENDGLLSWAVENEGPITDRYEIERSLNGVNFTKVTTVLPKNNGLSANTYTLTDFNLAALRSTGVIYYRIKQIDKDGQFVYSEIRSIRLDGRSFAVGVFPNPVKNTATVNIDLAEDADVVIRITDAAGKSVKQILVQGFKGPNVTKVDMNAYASGSYVFHITAGTEQKNITVVKGL